MTTAMTNSEILRYLPHRYPFLLVDKVVNVVPGESIHAVKNVSNNEPFFAGHFPSRPIMPGVLIIEALAQASGVLLFNTVGRLPEEDELYFLAGVDKARFKRVVEPGDQLDLHIELGKHRQDVWKFLCKASVDGELVCSAEITNARGS